MTQKRSRKMPGWWKGTAAAAYLAATAPFYFLMVQPQFNRINSLKAAQERDISLDHEPPPARVQALRGQLRELAVALPPEKADATPLTLTAVSTLARQAGVRISLLEIMPGDDHEDGRPQTIVYRVIIDGRYPEITDFIRRVEEAPFNGRVPYCVLSEHEDGERAELHLVLEGV